MGRLSWTIQGRSKEMSVLIGEEGGRRVRGRRGWKERVGDAAAGWGHKQGDADGPQELEARKQSPLPTGPEGPQPFQHLDFSPAKPIRVMSLCVLL